MNEGAPNILFLMSDQMSTPILPIHGRPICQAPHIEALADSGVVFDNAYCNYPLCVPARFSMLSGAGWPRQLPTRGSHGSGRAPFGHPAPQIMVSLLNGTHCARRAQGAQGGGDRC